MQGRFSASLYAKIFLSPSILEHRRTCDRTAPAALHRRLNVGLSSYAPAPNATASSSAISAQTGRICIKTSREDTRGKRRRAQGKLCRAQDTAAPGSQPRYDGMRHCSKNAYLANFKTTAAETANTPARFALKQYRRVQNAAQTACRRIRLNSDLS